MAITAPAPPAAAPVRASPKRRARRLRLVGATALVLVVGVVAGATLLKVADDRSVDRIWHDLERIPSGGQVFAPDLVAGLPGPARRYFLHAIRPGTPLAARVRLAQTGSIRIGEVWAPFSVDQVLTPYGFVWKAASRVGPLPITATDHLAGGQARMRIAAFGLVPFVNETGPELTRSTIGRLIVEYMWLPSALLPQAGTTIEPVDDERFGAAVTLGGERARLVLRVDAHGRLLENSLPRWGNGTADQRYRYIPFGGPMDAEATFGGYTVPTRIRMGWWYGTDRFREDFRFRITAATYA